MKQSKLKLNSASEVFSVSLPGWLIEIMDDICEKFDFNRSTFVKHAIKKAILLKSNDPETWEILYDRAQNSHVKK